MRYPGTSIVEFLTPLPPGLPRKELRKVVEERLEAACDRLLAEAASGTTPPPLPAEVKAKLASNEKRT